MCYWKDLRLVPALPFPQFLNIHNKYFVQMVGSCFVYVKRLFFIDKGNWQGARKAKEGREVRRGTRGRRGRPGERRRLNNGNIQHSQQ